VKSGGAQAKFWLNPVELAASYGYRAHELNRIEQIVEEHQLEFWEAWHEHLG
jgi:hypothetical protein